MAESKPTSSASRNLIVALACVIVVLAAASVWLLLQNQDLGSRIGIMNSKYDALNASHMGLQQDYALLFGQFSGLTSEYNSLQADNALLNARYASLSANYSALAGNYSAVKAYLGALGEDLRGFDAFVDSYCLFPQAITRTLNQGEISAVGWVVEIVAGGEQDPRAAEALIFGYINSSIAYESDVEVPYIGYLNTTAIDGSEYVTGLSPDLSPDYIASPSLTVYNGYGDCDDQAILGYAMIKYYEGEIAHQDAPLYLALLTFEDSALHLCLIRPAEGGYALILDPSGGYITPDYGLANASKAPAELEAYSGFWSAHGGIRELALYQVVDNHGNYLLAISGTVAEVAEFFT